MRVSARPQADRLSVHHSRPRPTVVTVVALLGLALLVALAALTLVVVLVRTAGGGVPTAPDGPGGLLTPEPRPGPAVVLADPPPR